MTYDIFISYKRLGASSATAAYLYELLLKKGYNVFFDRKEMRSGKFNDQLLEHISGAQDIIILLEEHSLDSWFKYSSKAPQPKSGTEQKKGMKTVKEEPYKTDWFCKEVMHALSMEGKRIIPVLLDGYKMPAQDELPEEMKDLSLHNALPLDISEIEEFYQKNLVEKEYLQSKPKNMAISRQYQNKGAIVGQFLFYTDAESCELYEQGERIITLTDDNDQHHPFRYPVQFAGEHRFLLFNNDTCEEQLISKRIEANNQEYVPVEWTETQSLWLLTEEQIAQQTDADKLFRWGKGLFKGTAKNEPNLTLATLCMEHSLSLGSEQAHDFIINCGSVDHVHQAEGKLAWETFAANQGNMDAQFSMGLRYCYADEVENDMTKAAEWFLKASEQGHVPAQKNMGVIYEFGYTGVQDYGLACGWYRKAAEAGNAQAQCNMGIMYEDGQGVEQSFETAVEWYRKAAEQGYADAQCNLGVMYEYGRGVEQSLETAVEWYRKAADQGDARGQFNLGTMYEYGQGVEQSYEAAVEWYRKAAEQGYDIAQCNLGLKYETGQGVEQSFETAVEWYRKAAEQGDARGQCCLGDMYESGQGVKQSYGTAMEWFRKAAEQDYADAQCRLGFMYELGRGVKQSNKTALEWYKKAAEQGFELAYNALAWCLHQLGRNDEALSWAEKAVEADFENPNTIDTLATVYQGLGRYDEAMEHFRMCLKLCKESNDTDGIERSESNIAVLRKLMKK